MHDIVAADKHARAATHRVMDLGLWPPQHGLLIYPDTVLNAEAGITIWRGQQLTQGTFSGLWQNEFYWDYAILIDDQVTPAEFPALFVWLLGHELAHAIAAADDPALFLAQLFVQGHARRASQGRIDRWSQVSFERIYDQFGLYVCESFFSREELGRDIEKALALAPWVVHSDRLERLVHLDPISTVPNMWEDLAQFVAPYRSGYYSEWQSVRNEPDYAEAVPKLDIILEGS